MPGFGKAPSNGSAQKLDEWWDCRDSSHSRDDCGLAFVCLAYSRGDGAGDPAFRFVQSTRTGQLPMVTVVKRTAGELTLLTDEHGCYGASRDSQVAIFSDWCRFKRTFVSYDRKQRRRSSLERTDRKGILRAVIPRTDPVGL